MKVLEYPLAKIAIWFILGLLASFYLNADPKIFIISGCILLPATVLFYLSSARHLNQKNYFGIVACMIFFLAGTASRTFGNSRFCKNHYANIIEPEKDYLVAAILIENLKSGTRNERYIAKITSLDSIKAQGRILLNIKKESLDKKLEIGTRLLYYGKIYEHRKPDNPDQFDYGKYLERKSVYGQIYAVASDIKVNPDVDKSIWHYASAFRNRIIENLK
ncbi:MAG TPA: ComEC/Rec2 family competence protein, partial [Flavobacterium sp.]|nr:ComEC/Rec2 family competence protein [Flavobacterium sp.]